jgi:hypothetical protein
MSRKPKASPPPWRLNMKGCETSYGLPTIKKANGHLIAHLCDRNEANGHLIEAAPDAVAACAAMLDAYAPHAQHTIDTEGESALHPAVILARAAIAKATRRTP